jgi:hypothetical protein
MDNDDDNLVIANDTTKISEKFSRSDWNLIEGMKTTNFDKLVIDCLVGLGMGKDEGIIEEFTVLGNYFYKCIRNKLKKYLVDNSEIAIEEKIQKLSKKDEIRFNNTITRINRDIDNLIKTFSDETKTDKFGFMSNCVEIQGITLMYCAYFVSKNGEKKDIYEIYVGIQKFIKSMKNYSNSSYHNHMEKEHVSQTLINDLEKWIEVLNNLETISGINIYKYAPHLIIYSSYDRNFVKPYESQKDLITHVKNNIDNGFLIMYNAMIGLGKTTIASVTLPIYVGTLRQQEK